MKQVDRLRSRERGIALMRLGGLEVRSFKCELNLNTGPARQHESHSPWFLSLFPRRSLLRTPVAGLRKYVLKSRKTTSPKHLALSMSGFTPRPTTSKRRAGA